MSTYGKRAASSPRENMSKNTKTTVQNHETEHESLVKIELDSINGKPYLGQVTDDELIYIWTRVFNQKKEDLFGITSTKSLTRNVRATFKLKAPIKIQEVFDSQFFAYEKVLDEENSDEVTGKIIGYGAQKPAEIGELTRITVKTNFGVEASGVLNWLDLYGTVTSNNDFVTNKATGLKTDVFSTEIVLKKHVQEYLPMYGQKVQVSYPGIPRMCNRCYMVGHLRRDCNNKKKDWIVYVNELLEDGSIRKELIGSWKNAIAKWKNANSNPEKV